MKKSVFILAILSMICLSFTSSTSKTTAVYLEQTCGTSGTDIVTINEEGTILYVKTTSSFRIQWQDGYGGYYYPAGTTTVETIYSDRFQIAFPGEASQNVKTYCYTIHR